MVSILFGKGVMANQLSQSTEFLLQNSLESLSNIITPKEISNIGFRVISTLVVHQLEFIYQSLMEVV